MRFCGQDHFVWQNDKSSQRTFAFPWSPIVFVKRCSTPITFQKIKCNTTSEQLSGSKENRDISSVLCHFQFGWPLFLLWGSRHDLAVPVHHCLLSALSSLEEGMCGLNDSWQSFCLGSKGLRSSKCSDIQICPKGRFAWDALNAVEAVWLARNSLSRTRFAPVVKQARDLVRKYHAMALLLCIVSPICWVCSTGLLLAYLVGGSSVASKKPLESLSPSLERRRNHR